MSEDCAVKGSGELGVDDAASPMSALLEVGLTGVTGEGFGLS